MNERPLKVTGDSRDRFRAELSVVRPQECLQFSDVGQGDSFFSFVPNGDLLHDLWKYPNTRTVQLFFAIICTLPLFDVLGVCSPPQPQEESRPRHTKAEIRHRLCRISYCAIQKDGRLTGSRCIGSARSSENANEYHFVRSVRNSVSRDRLMEMSRLNG